MNGLQKKNNVLNLHNAEARVELFDSQPRHLSSSAWNGRVIHEEASGFDGRNGRRRCGHGLQLV